MLSSVDYQIDGDKYRSVNLLGEFKDMDLCFVLLEAQNYSHRQLPIEGIMCKMDQIF